MSESDHNLAVDPRVLAILRCPLTHSPLKAEGDELVAEIGGLRYPIRDGFPVLLAEEAKLPQGVASLDEFKRKYATYINE
jgi:uncharacterized protein